MPPVPDAASDAGRNDDEREAATRLSGPLFRDEARHSSAVSAADETAILPPPVSSDPPPPGGHRRRGHGRGNRGSHATGTGSTNGNGNGFGNTAGNGDGKGDSRPSDGGGDGSGNARPGHPAYGQDRSAARPPHQQFPPPDATPSPSAGHGAPGQSPAPAAARTSRAGRNLKAAVAVGLGLGAVIIAALFVFKAVFLGVVVVAVVVGVWELTTRLSERKNLNVPLIPLATGGAATLVVGYLRGAEGAWVAMAMTTLALLVWRMSQPPENYLRDVAASVFAAFYVPFLATFVVLMLAADDGPWRVLTFLVLTVCSDTGAYAVGFRFGKRKLAPRISPGKTWEGLFGAVGFSMLAGALCMHYAVDGGTWWQGLIAGLLVAVSATLGDLGESMIKRDLGIKDMGTLLPGHGGIMDRLDSLLPTAPVVWLLFVIFVGSG